MSRLIAGVFVSLVMSITGYATESQKGNPMTTHPATLWQLIEALIEHPAFNLETIGQVLPVDFSERHRSAGTSFYEGGALHLADRTIIETIHLGIRRKNGISKWVGLDIAPNTTCITRDEVKTNYPDIIIISAPRGHSLDEMTTWGIRRDWGEVVFGFKERNPRCLAHIGIDRAPRT